MSDFRQIMLHLDTLGETADAVIMSISGVRFDLETGEIDDKGFYSSVSIDSNLEHGRTLEEWMLVSWVSKTHEHNEVFREAKVTLPVALNEFLDWMGSQKMAFGCHIWSDYDAPTLLHALAKADLELPLPLKLHRSYRNYVCLTGAEKVVNKVDGSKKHGLMEAINKAKHVINVHKHLFGKKCNPKTFKEYEGEHFSSFVKEENVWEKANREFNTFGRNTPHYGGKTND